MKRKKKQVLVFQLAAIVLLSIVTVVVSLQTLEQQHIRSRAQTATNCTVDQSELVMTASEQKLLSLINAYRQQNGAPPMVSQPQLKQAAEWLSNHMATGGPFDHTDGAGRSSNTRMKNCGFTGNTTAENIAYNQDKTDSAAKTFDQWKNSAGHNKIMLTATYVQVGIAEKVAPDGKNHYWTLDAGAGGKAGSVPNAQPLPPTAVPTKPPAAPTQPPVGGGTNPTNPAQPTTGAQQPTTPHLPTPTFTCLGACITETPTEPPFVDDNPGTTQPTPIAGGGGGGATLPADQGLITLILILIIQIIRGLFGGF